MADDKLDIDEIRKRAKRVSRNCIISQSIGGLSKRDAEKALERVPALCDEVERLREALREIREQDPPDTDRSEEYELRKLIRKNWATARNALEGS